MPIIHINGKKINLYDVRIKINVSPTTKGTPGPTYRAKMDMIIGEEVNQYEKNIIEKRIENIINNLEELW